MKRDNSKYEKYLEAATAEMDVDHCILNNSMSPEEIMSSFEDFVEQLPDNKKRKVIRGVHATLMGKVRNMMHGK